MKKLFAITAVLILALSFTACSGGTEKAETAQNTENTKNTESTEASDVLKEYISTTVYPEGNTKVYREEINYSEGGRKTEELSYDNDELIGRILMEKDADGNILKYTSYDGKEKQTYSWSAEYDTEGNMIKQIFYDESGAEESFDQWIYDERGLLVEEISRGDKYYTYEYDENGYRTKAVHYDTDGSEDPSNSYIFENDENGNVIRRIGFDEKGNPKKYPAEYEYNSEGKETAAIIYNEDGTLWERRERTYDSNGNILEMSTVSSDGTKTVDINYLYDKDGNPQEVTAYKKGEVSDRYVYEYDENGNRTKEYAYDGYGTQISEETRTYDEAGNLIKCVYEDVKSGAKTTEEYTYGPIE